MIKTGPAEGRRRVIDQRPAEADQACQVSQQPGAGQPAQEQRVPQHPSGVEQPAQRGQAPEEGQGSRRKEQLIPPI